MPDHQGLDALFLLCLIQGRKSHYLAAACLNPYIGCALVTYILAGVHVSFKGGIVVSDGAGYRKTVDEHYSTYMGCSHKEESPWSIHF